MANGYMPRRDADARAYMLNFAQQLVDRPEVYHVSPQKADSVRGAVEAFSHALQLSFDPATRSVRNIFLKDEARRAAELACRPIYLHVKVDPSITDADKLGLGVRPMNAHRTRIGPPADAPWLSLVGLDTSGHTLAYSNAHSPSLAKPFGATQLQLFCAFPRADWTLVGCFTRIPIRVDSPLAMHGQFAMYRARWMNRKGQVGPWSNELSAPVVAVLSLGIFTPS